MGGTRSAQEREYSSAASSGHRRSEDDQFPDGRREETALRNYAPADEVRLSCYRHKRYTCIDLMHG